MGDRKSIIPMVFQKRYIKRPAHSCFFIINIKYLQAGIAILQLAAVSKQDKPAVDQCIISSAIFLLPCIKNNVKVNDFKFPMLKIMFFGYLLTDAVALKFTVFAIIF